MSWKKWATAARATMGRLRVEDPALEADLEEIERTGAEPYVTLKAAVLRMETPEKPSDILLVDSVPLCGTMGRVEIEHAAAVLVWVLQQDGDAWGPRRRSHVAEVVRGFIEENGQKSLPSWFSNPFFRPDFPALAESRFATEDEAGIRFTTDGLLAMARRWDRRGRPWATPRRG